jgi:hypothetical protein
LLTKFLDPADVEDGGTELDLIPAQVAQFRRSQPCRNATRIMVESRCPCRFALAASISASTSLPSGARGCEARRLDASSEQLFDLPQLEAPASDVISPWKSALPEPPFRTVTAGRME